MITTFKVNSKITNLKDDVDKITEDLADLNFSFNEVPKGILSFFQNYINMKNKNIVIVLKLRF